MAYDDINNRYDVHDVKSLSRERAMLKIKKYNLQNFGAECRDEMEILPTLD